MADLKKEVEAILFSAGRTVELRELQKLLHVSEPGLIKETIRELKQDYEQKDSPLMILSEDDGWKLTVKEKYLRTVQKINPHTELSKTILETLSVIAWKQPVLQSDVIKIRTNKAYDHISELERLGFISKERQGRSFMLKVTQKFLDYFDLPDADAIKDMFSDFKDIEVAVQKKAGELEKGADKPDGRQKKGEYVAEEGITGVSGHSEDGGGSVESVDLEPYVDVLPEKTKPHVGVELETYRSPPPGAEEGEPEEEEKDEGDEDAEEGGEGEGPRPGETEEEKAKRIARELLEEEQKKEKEEGEASFAERKLHPKLEHFIEGDEEQLAPKPAEKHGESEEEEDKEEHEESEEDGEESGASHPEEGEEEHEDAEEGDAADKEEGPLKAEEYPGQFAQEGKEDSGEGEGKEEEDEKT